MSKTMKTLNGYEIVDNYARTQIEQNKNDIANLNKGIEGTVEITSGEPEKTGTVLTINPSAEEVELYDATEVDAMVTNIMNKIAEETENRENAIDEISEEIKALIVVDEEEY